MKPIHIIILVLIAIMCGCTDTNRAKTYLLPPTSLGLEEVAPKVFVNKEMSPIQREEFSKIVTEARKKVAVFLGDVISGPQILACSTEDCFVGLGVGRNVDYTLGNRKYSSPQEDSRFLF